MLPVRANEMVPVVSMEEDGIHVAPKKVSTLADWLSCLVTPFFCCLGSVQVKPRHETIVTHWGIPKKILKGSGFYLYNQCGVETHEVFMGNETVKIKNATVSDLHGNPVKLRAQYTYRVIDSLKAHYGVGSLAAFVQQQALAALLKVAGNYPYDSEKNIPRLCVHSEQIDDDLKATLNGLIQRIGLKVVSFKIMSIVIDKNMQKLLLAKQEAQAYITGRKKTAESAFQIVKETVEALKARNILLTDEQRNALVNDLLYMICSPENTRLDFYQDE